MARYLVIDNGNRVHDGSCIGVYGIRRTQSTLRRWIWSILVQLHFDLPRTNDGVKCLVLVLV